MNKNTSFEEIHQKFQDLNLSPENLSQRIGKLKNLKKLILKRKKDISQALYLDFGRSDEEVQLSEVMPVLSAINYSIKHYPKFSKPKKYSNTLLFKGMKAWTKAYPKGKVLIISPWNYPFQLCVYPFVTSYVCGNSTIIKPSEFTPHINQVIDEILSEVFDSHEVCMVYGQAQETQELLAKGFDHVFFTGSTEVGKIIMKECAQTLSSVGLELGGKSPSIIDKDYDLEDALKKIIWGKMLNLGQTCVAPDYLLIHKDYQEKIEQKIHQVLDQFYPAQKDREALTKVINQKHQARLEGLIDDAKNKQAKIIEHQTGLSLVFDVNLDMKVMKEEIFGPILPIVFFQDQENLKTWLDANPNPLALYYFSNDLDKVETLSESYPSGAVVINDVVMHVAHPSLPFGGVRGSGLGAYHGEKGFEEFSHIRPFLKRSLNLGASYFYPPYNAEKKKLIHQLLEKFSHLF